LADFNRSSKLSINHQNPYVFLAIVTCWHFLFSLVALALEALLKALVERWLVRLLNVLTNSVGFTFC
jgi:hypothetical protein